MNNRIRFHLDEQVKSVIAHELRRREIDVTNTVEAGLRTKTDEEQLESVRQEQRVIFTQLVLLKLFYRIIILHRVKN